MNIERQAYSVRAFCDAYDTSRAALYRMWQNGAGPVFYHVGRRRMISVESANAWQRTMQKSTAAPDSPHGRSRGEISPPIGA